MSCESFGRIKTGDREESLWVKTKDTNIHNDPPNIFQQRSGNMASTAVKPLSMVVDFDDEGAFIDNLSVNTAYHRQCRVKLSRSIRL